MLEDKIREELDGAVAVLHTPKFIDVAMDVIAVARALIKSADAQTWMGLSDALAKWDALGDEDFGGHE